MVEKRLIKACPYCDSSEVQHSRRIRKYNCERCKRSFPASKVVTRVTRAPGRRINLSIPKRVPLQKTLSNDTIE